ncbi:pilus assembly protein [Aeoliella sp. ICT_H6.2]|uniref:Pilus assembly protein n=1 Tax=Aeoliella straminimaris TaxID=2954799 RepID=A0A9X2F7U3_9BACT|nr:TadE family protein [Aeoliella straminimaris]MCO6043449.1 pilus assembly protein [Aeoliella straminimaris]
MLAAKPRGRMPSVRKAVAATELAICLPLVAMLLLASIEACGMIYLSHSLAIASYEGARVAINYDSTTAEVNTKCSEMITARRVADGDVDISPPDVKSVPRGQAITVTVSAPCDSNALVPPWFFGGRTLSSSTVMVKE